MHRRSNSREQLNLMLDSALDIHEKLLELNDTNVESTISFLHFSTPYLKDKLLLRKLLFMVNSLMSCQPLRFKTFYTLLSSEIILKAISKFFTSDELFSIFEMNKPVLALLFDHHIVSIQQLDKNLDYYVDNQDHFFFFHREIKASSERRYDYILKSNPEFYEFVTDNLTTLEEHQIYRKSGINESTIAQIIRKDDVEALVAIIRKHQKMQQKSSRFSIDIDLSHYNINFNCNAQDGQNPPKEITKKDSTPDIVLSPEDEEMNNYCNYIYYSFDMEVPHSIYEVTQFDIMFGTYPTLIEYAAFFRSVNIFNFLMKKLHVTCRDSQDIQHPRPRKSSKNQNSFIQQPSFAMSIEASDEASSEHSKLMLFAVAGGSAEIIRSLYEKGFRFDVKCLNAAVEFHQLKIVDYIHNTDGIKFDFYSLSKAIISYNIRSLIDILKESSNISLVSRYNNWDVLQISGQVGQLEAVQFLVEERKMDINRQNGLGNTCLQLACENGFADIVEYLLSLTKKSLLQPSQDTEMPPMVATTFVHSDNEDNDDDNEENDFKDELFFRRPICIKKSLDPDDQYIVDVNIEIDEKGNAIHYAVRNEHLKVVKLLAEHPGIDLNARNANAETPLFVACKHSFIDIVRYLISIPGVDLNARADNFMTPLLIASKYGYLEVVQILCGKDTVHDSTTGAKKQVPLSKKIQKPNDADAENESNEQQNIADLNVRGTKRMTPLLLAVKSNQAAVVEFFLSLEGVDVLAMNKMGENALHIAARSNNQLPILQMLINTRKFDVNRPSQLSGETILHIAARNKAKEIYDYLIQSASTLSLNTEIKDSNGKTAIEIFNETSH